MAKSGTELGKKTGKRLNPSRFPGRVSGTKPASAAEVKPTAAPVESARGSAPTVFSPKSLLFGYQRRFIDDGARFKIAVMSRQTGKSFTTSGEAVEDCLTNPGSSWVCMSAGERQALEWLEKAKEWSSAYRLAIEAQTEDRGGIAEALLKQAEIRYANGSRIISIPANPKTARGYSANIVLDEFGYHEDPDAIWRAMFASVMNPLAGTFMDRVQAGLKGEESHLQRALKVRVVSTFNGRGNKFFDLWEHRQANGWNGHLVTIEDAVRDGLPLDIRKLHDAMADEDGWQQEFMCVPLDNSNVLLPYELIALAESAEATEVCDISALSARGNALYCGIDFGRQNDPTVCWTWELVGDVLWTREVLVLQSMDVPAQQQALWSRIKASRRTCFDYTGPGVGLGDFLSKEHGQWDPTAHRFGKVELCTFTLNLKREMFPRLRRRFEAPAKCRVPISRNVREDLHAMQQTLNNGTYNYWAPRTREGHSDRCTAAALGVRAADFDAGGGGCGIVFAEDAA